MQDSDLFEYAVIRVVPRVEREEFLNVGVILLCVQQKFLRCRISMDEVRLSTLCKEFDVDELKDHISSFTRICEGGMESAPIGLLPLAERFRWLTATRSTVLQTSRVHPGLCTNAQETLDQLMEQLVII